MLTDDTMRILRLISHDEQFEFNENQAGTDPVILNMIDLTESNFVEILSEKIFSDGSGADFLAKCQCGNVEGNTKIGMKCPICGTHAAMSHLLDDDNLVCKNWLSCPTELPGGWIAPKIYLNLATWLSYDKGKRNYLDDILDVTTPIPFDLVEVVDGKGFAYLHDNFDRIMDYFIYNHAVISKKPDTLAMKHCLMMHRKKVWCHKIPILNSAINPIMAAEGGGANKKRYTDVTANHILQAAVSLSRLRYAAPKRQRQLEVEKTTYKAFKDVINYVEEATKKYISTKKAIPRTHMFGSRFHWSFRGVVVPIVGPHKYYELHVPWKMAVNTLRVQILGRLTDEYGLSINQAYSKVRRALQMVDPDIKRIMDRFIDESPFKGIPCVWDRPPSIRDGSVQEKFWTVIKTDLEDECVGMTPFDVALQNADFDGDNLAGVIIPEVAMANAFRNLSPSAQIHHRNTGEVSSEIGIPKTLAIPWNAFLGNM